MSLDRGGAGGAAGENRPGDGMKSRFPKVSAAGENFDGITLLFLPY